MLLCSPLVLAATGDIQSQLDQKVTESVQQSNRFLSAEAQREIRTGLEKVQTDLKAYQDENFLALDREIKKYQYDLMQKVILGSLGAVLVGGALVAILMYRVTKKNSVQDFESKVRVMDQGQVQAQAPAWQMPVQESMGTAYGQKFVGNHSAFNNWQAQSPYHGGWQYEGQQPPQQPPNDDQPWNKYGGGQNGQ
jgi:hypothetical protein